MSAPRTTPVEPRRPSEAAAAAITVAVCVYLCGLALSIIGNTGSGPSALVRVIKGRLFAPWLVPAWLDLGFEHRLTWGVPEDADHSLELRGQSAGGGPPLTLPGPGGGERAARWRRLARAIASDADGGDNAAILASAVAAGAFDDLGTEDVRIRVLRSPVPDRTAAVPTPAEQAYAARVRRVAGELQLIKDEPRGEVAPLVRPAGRGPQPTPAATRAGSEEPQP
jgi:hypothetical protein